ncbi:uncharacterized protein LOC118438882 [Folsomia candida]|uniref:uncharacterized protein LOC118438882 n=1 Tax=Folsomia candida TaxID=158441 RepID=UPI00160537BE|nr:uncharacterized protein LOC118438882 [Folsomia candida]XP_035715595.1 uncharacterized protein LOC118438882 [Folsomia candida]
METIIPKMGDMNLEEISLLRKAIMNPVILDKIFSHLDFLTLKNSVRSVCTVWADVGATLIGRRGRIVFSDLGGMTSFNPNLARNIYLNLTSACCCCVRNCKCQSKNPACFSVIVMPEVSKILARLEIYTDNVYGPRLNETWTGYNFRNRLSILVEKWGDDDLMGAPRFLPLPNLRSLSFQGRDSLPNKENSAGEVTIFQGILNSTPNLEEVAITANFYPDFAPCTKLKILKYKSICGQTSGKSADKFPLSEMLAKCPNSLEKFTLGVWEEPVGQCVPVANSEILSFGLLNLSHLVIKAAELYEIEDISRLPKLTHLTLKTVTYGVSMSKMFQNYHSRHKGITRLELEFMPSEDEQDTQAAEKIVKLFPGVTQFKINLDGAQNLAKTMRPFRAWRLASGEVNIEEVKSADVVAAVLEGLAEWRGLRNTKLVFRETYQGFILQMSDRVRDALVLCSSISNIHLGIPMDKETRTDLNAFIAKYNLPISF